MVCSSHGWYEDPPTEGLGATSKIGTTQPSKTPGVCGDWSFRLSQPRTYLAGMPRSPLSSFMALVMHLKMPTLVSSTCGCLTRRMMSTFLWPHLIPRSPRSRGCPFPDWSYAVHRSLPLGLTAPSF